MTLAPLPYFHDGGPLLVPRPTVIWVPDGAATGPVSRFKPDGTVDGAPFTTPFSPGGIAQIAATGEVWIGDAATGGGGDIYRYNSSGVATGAPTITGLGAGYTGVSMVDIPALSVVWQILTSSAGTTILAYTYAGVRTSFNITLNTPRYGFPTSGYEMIVVGGNAVWMTDYINDQIFVLDFAGTVTQLIQIPFVSHEFWPSGLAVMPALGTVWVMNHNTGAQSISQYTFAGASAGPDHGVGPGLGMIAVGANAWITNQAQVKIFLPTFTLLQTLTGNSLNNTSHLAVVTL